MKKLYLLISVLMVVLLGVTAMAYGDAPPPLGEASVFDGMENWIIRAYVVEPAAAQGPPYVIKFQVIKPDGSDVDPTGIITNDVKGLPADITDAAGTEISLTFDNNTGVTYLIYTNSAREIMSYTIESAGPKIAVNHNTLSFGNLTTGTFSTMPVTVSNTGTRDLTLNTIGLSAGTNAAYTIMSGTGACTTGVVLHPSPSTDSCTITVRFAPTVAGNPINGTLVITSNGSNNNGQADVSLNGSATAPVETEKPDLILTDVKGISSGWTPGTRLNIITTVRNNGKAAVAGSFTVKGYLNASGTVPAPGATTPTPIFTYSVNGLAAETTLPEKTTQTVPLPSVCAIHSWCKFVIFVDADYQVVEKYENNNIYMQPSLRGE